MSNQALPAQLAQIAEIAGREAALKLAFSHGGSRVYVPRKTEGTDLAQLIGNEAAKALAGAYGGEAIAIPVGKKAMAYWLDEQGWTREKIAIELRVDRTTVHRWFSGRMDKLQLKLFVEPSSGGAGHPK